jgi:propionyl-CoA carboxylase alpha chain
MEHPRWKEGALSTGFIAEEFPEGFKPVEPAGEVAHLFAAVAASIDHKLNSRKRGISGQMRTSNPVTFDHVRVVMLGGHAVPVTLHTAAHGDHEDLVVEFDGGHRHQVHSDWLPGQPVWSGRIDSTLVVMQVRPILNGVSLAHSGFASHARVLTREEAHALSLMPEKLAGDSGKQVLCPMPGLVKAISVKVGQEIKAGEMLCIVEAMKMENVLRAERDGTIASIAAKEGDSLAVDAVILEFA